MVEPIKIKSKDLLANVGQELFVPTAKIGESTIVIRSLTPQGWPVFNKRSDPDSFGPLTLQGERGNVIIQAMIDQAKFWRKRKRDNI